MISYKSEFWAKEVDEKIRPDIVFQIKMKEKKHREKWTRIQKLTAKGWLLEQRN